MRGGRRRGAGAWVAAALLAVSTVAGGITHAAEPGFAAPTDLVQAARREGSLVLYSANFNETEQVAIQRFNARFPDVKVELVRAPSGQLLTRLRAEAAANRLAADVVDITDRSLALEAADLFAPYSPPNAAEYPPETRTLDKFWPRTGNAWGIAYNPALVADPPKTWRDLPEHGTDRIGVTVVLAGGGPWTLAMFQREVLGEEYWQRLAAAKPVLYPSQAPLVDAMVRGEIGIAPLVTQLAIPLEQQGAPIRWFIPPEGSPTTVFAAGITRTSLHPNAAKLFLDWSLSREGQTVLVELGSMSAMTDAPPPPGVDRKDVKIWLPDFERYDRLRPTWIADWNQVFGYRQ